MKRDLYQEVTDKIVAALEQGKLPFTKPWSTAGGLGLPENAITKRPYRGINVLLLSIAAAEANYPTDQWVTFKQAAAAGVPVRKGEKATRIYFFKRLEVEDQKDVAAEGQEKSTKVIPLLREFYVFNVAQLAGELPNAKPAQRAAFVGIQAADEFFAATGATIKHGGNGACYIPAIDEIRLPQPEAFRSPADYYAVKAHELTHWTGHASRCARDFSGRFGDAAYAFEELVAEMGAAFICAQLGIDGQLQHAAYIQSWIGVLKNDKRAIFTASSAAQKAVDFVRALVAPAAAEEQEAA